MLKVYSSEIEKYVRFKKGISYGPLLIRPSPPPTPYVYVLNSMSRRDSICYRFKFSARALINVHESTEI